jgi:uncharacterized repeat protein (TIGR01451 family)
MGIRVLIFSFRNLFVVFAYFWLIITSVNAQTITQYTNTTTGAITDSSTCAVTVTRTFTVPTSFVVGDVDFGVLLAHTFRSDLRISLRSPAGTTVQLLLNTGTGVDNLNVLFNDEATAAIATHTTVDTVGTAPPYQRNFIPNSPLSAFDGQNASGTWTMVICDSVAVDSGTFMRADLYITAQQVSVTKTSTIVSDGISTADPKAIPGATLRYCILITNTAGGAAMSNIAEVDALPANVTFVPGSITSGTSCAGAATVEDDNAAGADETDPFGASFSGGTVTATATSVAPGNSFATVFLATLN